MSSLAVHNHTYISASPSTKGINPTAVVQVGLLHTAMALLLFSSWSPTETPPVPVKTLNIQMFTLPKVVAKPVVEPVIQTPKPEVVVKAKPEVKSPVVNQDLAFKRVKKAEVKPVVKPKPVVKKKAVQPKPKVIPKKTVVEKKPTKMIDAKKIVTAAAATSTATTADNSPVNSVPSNTTKPQHNEQYLPIDKSAPSYPKGALRKNLEGDCTVEYDVNIQGQVESPKIVGKCHPLFKRTSLAAAKKFRYKPRIVNGHAVVVENVKNTFEYRLK